jgi:hypothetical protein
MFLPVWAFILIWVILISCGYFAGALMQTTKTRKKIAREMAEKEVVSLICEAVAEELKKRMAGRKQ